MLLKADDSAVPLEIVDVSIPEPGYPKVPRISVITLSGELDQSTRQPAVVLPGEIRR